MKILLIHNFYGSESPSGENVVFESETLLLERMGHTVESYIRRSDEIRNKGKFGTLRGAFSVPWNPFAAKDVSDAVNRFKPDVVHVHNTFPLISPAIFQAIGTRAAKVLTLHNYRLLCPAAIPIRNNNVCTECIEQKSVLPSLQYGCYRGSRFATFPLAVSVAIHRKLGTWANNVDSFIALTDFQKNLMSIGGLQRDKIHIKPNFYPGFPTVLPFEHRKKNVVFVGRLGVEKGVRTMIDAWRTWGPTAPTLKIIGDGPLRAELEGMVKNLSVELLGQIPYESVQSEISNSQLLLLPSECFEGFPMVIREAFALGTPVAVSNLGPLPSIVEDGVNGVVFEAYDPDNLRSTVGKVLDNILVLSKMSNQARRSFETLYNEKANYEILMDIYTKAIAENKRKIS